MQKQFNKICSALGVDTDKVLSSSRKTEYVEARQIFCLLLHNPEKSTASNIQLARFLNRDRTTIIHSLRRVNDLMDTEPAFRDKVNKIREEL